MDGTVRRLDLDDLPACQRLAVSRDWGAEDRKWRLLFEVGNVYGLDEPDGDGLLGTVVSTPYDRDVAAISMVLTAPRHERRGIAGNLMRYAMEHAGTASLCLTATEYGRPLYERLGFRSVGHCVTYTGVMPDLLSPARKSSAPAEPDDISDVVALDNEVFGAKRTALMRQMPSFCEDFRVIRNTDGSLEGFGGRWRNGPQTMMGPVIAQDEKTATTLLDELAVSELSRLDIDTRHPEIITWAEKRGLRVAFTTTVMEYGAPISNDLGRLYLPVAQALG
ncbi:GNAT family N-acetyltransferase [Actinomadura litoris]|uniref:GNAT family N-acetyltransferase n=1 Tax=Actinomadura litoris TaxID=2678616 RepID=UPI001FA7ACE5|nr:GNAT family N-acetyltransferase [Actinomadura litoris]